MIQLEAFDFIFVIQSNQKCYVILRHCAYIENRWKTFWKKTCLNSLAVNETDYDEIVKPRVADKSFFWKIEPFAALKYEVGIVGSLSHLSSW